MKVSKEAERFCELGQMLIAWNTEIENARGKWRIAVAKFALEGDRLAGEIPELREPIDSLMSLISGISSGCAGQG